MNDKVNVKDRFFLTDGDRLNPAWVKLLDHLKERLAAARSKNDHAQSEIETATLRGQIKELKYLISLSEDRKIM